MVGTALYKVAPLVAAICWGFAIINVCLGVGLLLVGNNTVPIAVADILSYPQWGFVFIALGAVMMFFLLTARNTRVRQTLLLGVFVKGIWLTALIINTLSDLRSIVVMFIWLFFAYIQIMTYAHFDEASRGNQQQQ